MPAASTEKIAVLTLTWINANLREEVERLYPPPPEPPRARASWPYQLVAALSGLVTTICLIVPHGVA